MRIPNIAEPLVERHGETLHLTRAWQLYLAQVLSWNPQAPVTVSSPGTQGQVAYDQSSMWVCVQKDTWIRLTPSASGGGGGGGGGTGTVTSVGLSMPPEFAVAGSPITTAGTLAVSKANQQPNTFYRGPSSGPAAPPSFGPITLADLPAIPDNDALANDSDVSLSGLANGDFLRYNSPLAKWQNQFIGVSDLPQEVIVKAVGITIDGGASTPSAGIKGLIQVPVPCTIIGWSVTADQVGSLTMEIDARPSNPPPAPPSIPNTSSDVISAFDPIVLSGAQTASGDAAMVATWTTGLAQWDSVQFHLLSASTFLRATVYLVVVLN